MPDYESMKLSRLLEERDHMRIQVNLIQAVESSSDASLEAVEEELARLERLVATRRREALA